MDNKIFYLLVGLMVVVSMVQAAPTTGAVTNVTNGYAVFHATGAGSTGWFEWGATSGGYYKWKTPNQSYSTSFSDYQMGSPMLTGRKYYVRACDNTGCGSEVSWTTLNASYPNATSYGTSFTTLLRSGFNGTQLLGLIAKPYTSTVPGGAPVTYGLLFFFVFAGYWLRHRDITIPCFLAMLSGGAIWIGTSALGVPAEFAMIGQGLVYAAIAGMAVSWFSK